MTPLTLYDAPAIEPVPHVTQPHGTCRWCKRMIPADAGLFFHGERFCSVPCANGVDAGKADT